jgi:hypothetical protein
VHDSLVAVLQIHSMHASQCFTAYFPVTSLGLVLVSRFCIAAVRWHGLSSDRG